MPQKPIYVNGVLSDTAAYYNAISQLVQTTGWDGNIPPKYALTVRRRNGTTWLSNINGIVVPWAIN